MHDNHFVVDCVVVENTVTTCRSCVCCLKVCVFDDCVASDVQMQVIEVC